MKPNYLEKNTKTISQKKNVLVLSVICTCGGDLFDLLAYQPTPEMKKEEMEVTSRIRKDFGLSFTLEMKDELYIVKRFLGLVVKKRKYSDYGFKHPLKQFIVAKCKHCGESLALFDKEMALLGKEPGPIPDRLELIKENIAKLNITLYYDEPTSAMDFSRIVVKGVEHGKEITEFDIEV